MNEEIAKIVLQAAMDSELKLSEKKILEISKKISTKITEVLCLDDYEYLLHHVEVDKQGKESLHHCHVYDHIGNLFEQQHLVIRKGKVYVDNREIKKGVFHIISGLENHQEVAWSDEMAIENNINPKKMRSGMTFKEKAKVW